jgi:MinD superfamily P-loop ATPase
MGWIRHKIAAISRKGGVGKSTVATNVRSLDIDVHGYCIPKLDINTHSPLFRENVMSFDAFKKA